MSQDHLILLATVGACMPKTRLLYLRKMCNSLSLMILLFIVACHPPVDNRDDLLDLEDWRTDRLDQLNAEDGWLSLIGLYRLTREIQTLGSSPESDIRLPADFPVDFGKLHIREDQVLLETTTSVTVDGKPTTRMPLVPTGQAQPASVVAFTHYQMIIIRRGAATLLRLRDVELPAKKPIDAIAHFEPDPAWAVSARLTEQSRGDTIWVKNIIGEDVSYVSEGALAFELQGKTHQLVAFGGAETYFIMMADETTGEETYGGGRYLYVPKVNGQGLTTIDFNRAINPPCVFTDYATCPLPPRENYLPLRVEAGEKMRKH